MKILYKHLTKYIKNKPDINDLSEKLIQLGHEHEVSNNIFDIEFTPNRGDCLSIMGLIRDLNPFYDVEINDNVYEKSITDLQLKFKNHLLDFCPKISFLKLEIDNIPDTYNEDIESYFSELGNNKNNFFTDISNYISYETGQPTHCYDSSTVEDNFILDTLNSNQKFETLIDKTIGLKKGEQVFLNSKNDVINLAGIIGGKNTACNNLTKSVLIECAYFNPEMILGKALKYGINSDAAHKFERNTDMSSHEYVLRRFLKIVEEHTNIINAEMYSETFLEIDNVNVKYDLEKINSILGTKIKDKECKKYLLDLGFKIINDIIQTPSYRHDIKSINDIAEEIARVIGYNNIESRIFEIPPMGNENFNIKEEKIKNFLIQHGFYEVINDPFVPNGDNSSVKIDNPLDSNRSFLRRDLKESLLANLAYNERRQKDCLKLFEVSDVYETKIESRKKLLGIIASGRVDNNYEDFAKKINKKYLMNLLSNNIIGIEPNDFQIISRENINSKSKDEIIYIEIEIDSTIKIDYEIKNNLQEEKAYKYVKISEFPSSKRDLSFSITEYENSYALQDYILNFKNELLKEVFIFDYYNNEKTEEIKIGFRFIFQNPHKTITESEVNDIMNVIIENSFKIRGVNIPGIDKTNTNSVV